MFEILHQQFQKLFDDNKYLVVDFTKVNGDTRIMTCSLHPDVVPVPVFESLSVKKRHRTMEVMSVWDTNKQDWRAFKLASVNMISSINPETNEEFVLYLKQEEEA